LVKKTQFASCVLYMNTDIILGGKFAFQNSTKIDGSMEFTR